MFLSQIFVCMPFVIFYMLFAFRFIVLLCISLGDIFAKELMLKADVAVAPGAAFGEYGEGFVRVGLVENEQRIKQAAKNIKKLLL